MTAGGTLGLAPIIGEEMKVLYFNGWYKALEVGCARARPEAPSLLYPPEKSLSFTEDH